MEPNNLSVQTTQIASLENELSEQPVVPQVTPKLPPKQHSWKWVYLSIALFLAVASVFTLIWEL